jgi:hypothetical protein
VVQGVKGLILVGALFLLDGGGEEKVRVKKRGKEKERKLLWGGGFPQCWTHLASCAAVRCN